jgi:hypothetical protein
MSAVPIGAIQKRDGAFFNFARADVFELDSGVHGNDPCGSFRGIEFFAQLRKRSTRVRIQCGRDQETQFEMIVSSNIDRSMIHDDLVFGCIGCAAATLR